METLLCRPRPAVRTLSGDPNLSKYAEIIEKHGGSRYDVTVLGPPPPAPPLHNVDDASEEQILKALDGAERFGNPIRTAGGSHGLVSV